MPSSLLRRGAFKYSFGVSLASSAVLLLTACSAKESGVGANKGGEGSNTGGISSTMGGAQSGGATANGGSVPGTGGAGDRGGAPGVTGGNPSTGGVSTNGGSHATSGGNLGSGGTQAASGSAGQASKDTCTAAPTGVVTFSVPSSTFQGQVTVELRTTQSGAEIRYTTDRTAPSTSSPVYTSPLAFSSTTDLRAQAFVSGAPVGKPEAAVYISRSFDATHNLPVVVMDSYGKAFPAPTTTGGGGFGMQPISKEFQDVALLTFEPAAAGGTVTLSGAPIVGSSAAAHIRGQSSAMSYEKRPYRLETREPDNTDRNCPMVGMPRESDWVLNPPYPDKALIRNAFVYSLAKDLGLQAPRFAFIELYVAQAGQPLQASDYQGVYLLVETIKNQKDRLNLQQLKPTDTSTEVVSGGYIFKFEWQVTDLDQKLTCPSGLTNCWNWIDVVDPDPWAPEQQSYLTQFLQTFHTALHSSNPSDANSGYPAYLDVPSMVDTIILNEVTRNMDAYVRSQYFYKDRNSKLFSGPIWDFDLTAGVGSSTTYANMSQQGFQYDSNLSRMNQTVDWFTKLVGNAASGTIAATPGDAAFKSQLVTRWKELRQGQLSDAQVTSRIQQLSAKIPTEAAGRNFQKWPNLAQAKVALFQTPTADTWQGQIEAMRTWLIGRMAWLDSQWM